MKKVIAVISLVIMSLSGVFFYISRPVTDVVKPVSHYRQHQQELQNQIDNCGNNPGLLNQTQNCQKALHARQKNSIGANKSSMPQIK